MGILSRWNPANTDRSISDCVKGATHSVALEPKTKDIGPKMNAGTARLIIGFQPAEDAVDLGPR
jgi:hypothetical protein